MSAGNRTTRYVNTGAGEGSNQRVVLVREEILPEQPIPNPTSDCSSDPNNTICGFGIPEKTGTQMTLFGVRAGSKTNLDRSIFIGHEAGLNTTTGVNNMGIGVLALANGTRPSGSGNNIAIGFHSQTLADDGSSCISVGNNTLENLQVGVGNIAIGGKVLSRLESGNNNTCIGSNSTLNITTANNDNTCLGNNTLLSLTNGNDNTCLGKDSGASFLTGSNNITLGKLAGTNYRGAESDNILLGSDGVLAESGVLHIGRPGIITSAFCEGIHGVTPAMATQTVIIGSDGELGSTAAGTGLTGVTDTEQTLLGVGAMTNNISGDSNVVLGFNAMNFATTAGESVIIGAHAAENALNQGRGVFIGANSGLNADMTSGTVAVGFNTLQSLSGSTGNTVAVGFESLQACTSGGGNTAVGALTLKNLTTSTTNCAFGRFALTNIKDSCDSNTALGDNALINLGLGVLGTGNGSSNTGVGRSALSQLAGEVAGNDFNTAIGRSAGSGINFGSSNLYLGHLAGTAHSAVSPGESNNICIMNAGVNAESNAIHIGLATHTNTFLAGLAGVVPAGTPQAVIFDPLTGELGEGQITMDGGGNMGGLESMEIVNTVVEDDSSVVEIDVVGGGFSDVTGLNIVYKTGAINSGDAGTTILSSIIEDESLGGRIFGHIVTNTDQGSATVHGLGSAVGVNPIYHQSGTFINATSLTREGDDVLAALSSGGGGAVDLFLLLNDDFIIGAASKFEEVGFLLATGSSGGGVAPTWEYSTGVGTFAFFSPQDGTNGFRDSGIISWDQADLAGWAVDGSTEFTIRITRTRNSLSTTPIADLCQITSPTTYEWNKDGDVNIRSLTASTNVAGVDSIKLEGTGAASGFNCDFTGQIDIDSSLANTQSVKITSSAVAGGMIFTAGSGGINGTTTGGYDFHSSVNMAGQGIKLRATGTAGTITLDAQTGGVVVTNSDVNGLVMDDSTSLFNATLKASALMTASYNIVLPIAQAATDGQALVNNGSGTTRWDNPVAAFPNGWVNGLGMTNGSTTDTDKDIEPGECRSDDDTFNIVVSSTLTVDNTASGLNGLDTGSLAANTWYTIWVIDISSGSVPGSLMSLSETAPTLPGSYDVQRRVGWARTDGSSDFYKAFYGKSGQSRVALWDESETALEVLTDGSATVYTVVDCSEFIPPVTGGLSGYLNTNHFASDEQDFLTIAPTNLVPDLDGLSPVSNPRAHRTFGGASGATTATGSTFQFVTFSDDTGEILYGNSSATEDSDIWVIGYIDDLTV